MDKGEMTFTSEDHDYCEHTGFCKRCGSHREYVTYEKLHCIWASNSTAISHTRSMQIFARTQMEDAIKRLRELSGEGDSGS